MKLRAEVAQIGHLIWCLWLRLGRPVYQDDLFPGCELPFFVGVPLEDFHVPAAAILTAAREEFEIDPRDRVVCTVGRLDTAKGQIYLLDAAAQVLRQMPNVRFLLVGDGPDLQILEARARELGIEQNVVFTGYRGDVPALLGITDIVAMPSLWEGKPISLLEAMNLGKPVVGTPAVLSPDIMSNGDVGFVIPFRDAVSLAQKLLTLLRDPALAQEMGERGKARSKAYDLSKTVERLTEIYRELAKRHQRGPQE